MNREAHMNFTGRALLQLGIYVWRQLPLDYGIQVDASKVLRAITYKSSGSRGGRVSLNPWASAPNVNTVSKARKANLALWSAYQQKVRRFLPHLSSSKRTTSKAKVVVVASDDENGESEDEEDWSDDDGLDVEVPADRELLDEVTEAGMGDTSHSGVAGPEPPFNNETAAPNPRNGLMSGGGGGEGGSGAGIMDTINDDFGDGGEDVEHIGGSSSSGPKAVGGKPNDGEVTSEEEEMETLCTIAVESRANKNGHKESSGYRIVNQPALDVPERSATSRSSAGDEMRAAEYAKRGEQKRARTEPQGIGEESELPVAKRAKAVTTTPQPLPSLDHSMIYPFLQGLTLAVLRLEEAELYEEFSLALAHHPGQSTPLRLPELLTLYQDFCNSPFSQVAPIHVRALLEQIRGYPHVAARKAVVTRLERYSILLSSIQVWYWLDVTVQEEVKSVFQDNLATRNDWLAVAVKIAKDGLKNRDHSIIFNPDQYPQLMNLQSQAVAIPNRSPRIYLQGDANDDALLRDGTVQLIQKLLTESLGFDTASDMKERRRAWIMGTIANILGIDFLATRYAWNAWLAFTPKDYFEVGNGRTGRKVDSAFIGPFRDALQTHAICQDGTPENEAYMLFNHRLRDHSQYSSVTSHSPQPAFDRYRSLDSFLRGSLRYLSEPSLLNDPLHQYFQDQPDFRFPFRERAPSRCRFRGVGGPYEEEVVKTTEGIFSAVVYRGITYNTDFSMHPHSPMVFQDIADWNSRVKAHKDQHPGCEEDKHYFCKPNAYGQSIVGRGVEKANLYWDEAKRLNWPQNFTAAKGRMTFKECFLMFRTAHFTSMGNLCMFLLVGDLHYAGVCDAPTAQDVASFILAQGPNKSGSYKGLVELGLVGDGASRLQVEQALLAVESHIKAAFTEEEIQIMGLDLICVEHLLCKFS